MVSYKKIFEEITRGSWGVRWPVDDPGKRKNVIVHSNECQIVTNATGMDGTVSHSQRKTPK